MCGGRAYFGSEVVTRQAHETMRDNRSSKNIQLLLKYCLGWMWKDTVNAQNVP